MLTLKITNHELAGLNQQNGRNFSFEQWQTMWKHELKNFVKIRLIESGFDLSRPITRMESDVDDAVVFYQQEKKSK